MIRLNKISLRLFEWKWPCVWLLVLASCSQAPSRPNVVLIVVDTLRADRVSSYGYEKPTTPRIDALAAQGVRFSNAHSTSSWTLPAHASMFTGLYPIEHRATQENTRLGEDAQTLSESFNAHGYTTLGVSGNGVINRNSGLARGFSTFVEAWRAPVAGPAAPSASPSLEDHRNVAAVRDFLRDHNPDEPFFAFINFIEVHGPNAPPPPFRNRFLLNDISDAIVESATERKATDYYLDKESISREEFQTISDLYDGDVAYADALVGALLDEIEAAGALDNSLVVVTSDHGENLGDHDHFRHIFSLYGGTVRVPLIAKLPGGARAGEVRPESVSLVDVFATLLASASIKTSSDLPSRDILAPSFNDDAVFAEYYFPFQALGQFDAKNDEHRAAVAPYMRRLRSVESQGWRMIWQSDGVFELFDVKQDPDERVDLAGHAGTSEHARRLRSILASFVMRGGGNTPLPAAPASNTGAFGELDPETEQQLRTLGYLPDE